MKIRRCPELCYGPCETCGGTQYIYEDGTPATPQAMLAQCRAEPRVPYKRPSKFPGSRR